eukprot:11202077-Lingulodinium_polyedra.AAC.1
MIHLRMRTLGWSKCSPTSTNWFLGEPNRGELRAASMPEFVVWVGKVPKGLTSSRSVVERADHH